MLPNNVVYGLGTQRAVADSPCLVDRAEYWAHSNAGHIKPIIKYRHGPGWYGDRPDPATLAGEVRNHPSFLDDSELFDNYAGHFATSHTGSEEQGKDGPIPLSPQAVARRRDQECCCMLFIEPIAEAHTRAL